MDRELLAALVEDGSNESDVDEYLLTYMEYVDDVKNSRKLRYWSQFAAHEFPMISRFEKEDFERLRRALRIPDVVHVDNRSRFTGEDALLITLRRLAYPNRLWDVAQLFGRSKAQVSVCASTVVDLLYERWSHLLDFDDSRLGVDKLLQYAELVEATGCPIRRCIGYIDGTLRPMCRPKWHQQLLYNGHKRVHGIKFQSLVTPDGIISHLSGPFEGTRHDSMILAQSGLLQHMQQRFQHQNGAFCIYGDAAYPMSLHVVSPFTGARLNPDEIAFNGAMSEYRVCVEWGFGKIVQQFAFLDFKKNLKLYLQPVGKLYIIGALLTNCHTCLYGSQIARHFNANPPSLEEYLV